MIIFLFIPRQLVYGQELGQTNFNLGFSEQASNENKEIFLTNVPEKISIIDHSPSHLPKVNNRSQKLFIIVGWMITNLFILILLANKKRKQSREDVIK